MLTVDAANFYVIKPPGGIFTTQIAYGEREAPDLISDQCEYDPCPGCGRPPGKRIWLLPHHLSLSQRKYPDLLWVSGTNICATPAFREAFEKAGLAGIKGYDPPATVTRVGRRPPDVVTPSPPEYRRVRLEGWGANLDDAASGAMEGLSTRSCSFCRGGGPKSIDHVMIEPGSWTGLDIFLLRGLTGEIVVNERFRQMVLENGLQGILFCPGERFNFDHKTFRPPPETEEEIERGYGRVPDDDVDPYAQSLEPD